MRNFLAQFLAFSVASVLLPISSWAQGALTPRFEIGGAVLGSFYDQKTFASTIGNVNAGFGPGFGASAWLGNHMYPRVSGEIRYDYVRNEMKLDGSGASATFNGESHAVHYDIHYHFTGAHAKLRPFVIGGGGVKMFRGTGEERAFQPLSQVAVLTRTNELTGLLTFGVGVKMQLSERVLLRLELRDNLTRSPKKVIAPNRGVGGDGWVNNLLPSAGLSVLF
ncbi:MAG TPA: hypothetical protein VFQ91_11390 [Bryobacteraceae bacterium]|nr:hypothetical protein [Bryobacteraceae bacterium]